MPDDRNARGRAFEQAFEELCGAWLSNSDVPVLAVGMVGSTRGWVQVPYRTLPVDLDMAPATVGHVRARTGHRALKFYASVRLDIRRIETLKEGAEAVGNRARVKVVKNKVAPPFRQAEFDIIYGEGISHEGNLLDLGVERGMIQKSGAYFSFGDERLGQGRSAARAFLVEHTDVADQIEARIREDAGLTTLPSFDPETGEIRELEPAGANGATKANGTAEANGTAKE